MNYVPDAVDFFRNIGCRVRVGEATIDINEIIETFANKKARKLLSALPSIDDLCVLYVYVYVLLLKNLLPSGNILAKILHRNLGILGQQSWPRGSKILGSWGHSLGQDPGVLGGLTLAKRPKILPRSLPENPCLLAKILGFNPGFILQCILAFMYMHITFTFI